jgi:hypothetical protein
MAKKLTGGGSSMNKNVSPSVRTGSPNKATSPGAANQLGVSTAFPKEKVDFGRAYDGGKLGNEVALNVGKGGPGTGRTVMRSGSQGTHGSANPGHSPQPKDILSEYGPDIPGRK